MSVIGAIPINKIIAIVGTATTSREQANELPPEVERWGLASCYTFLNQIDRYFEVHTREWILTRAGKQYFPYLRFLQHFDGPVYMLEVDPTIPHAQLYPLEQMAQKFYPDSSDKPYFTSTLSYMMALAISEQPKEIQLLGVDFSTRMEYAHQRGGCEYFIGWAIANGIKVTIPRTSPILKAPLYGMRRDSKLTQDTILERIQSLKQREQIAVEGLVSLRAQIGENERWLEREQGLDMTGQIPAEAPVITVTGSGVNSDGARPSMAK